MKKYVFKVLVFGERHRLEIVAGSRKEACIHRNIQVRLLRMAPESATTTTKEEE